MKSKAKHLIVSKSAMKNISGPMHTNSRKRRDIMVKAVRGSVHSSSVQMAINSACNPKWDSIWVPVYDALEEKIPPVFTFEP